MLAFWKCPDQGWNYDSVKRSRRERTLRMRCERILKEMRRPTFALVDLACDTRPIHRKMFRRMTPLCFPSFAGNYRGDARYPCLVNYRVAIHGDPRVGTVPSGVATELDALVDSVRNFIRIVDQSGHLQPVERFGTVVQALCFVLVEFLRVHPYADGNGHMGRFIVWALLLRFGYVPRKWPLEERPPDPPYSNFISLWRSGNRAPLEMFLAQCVIG